MRQEDLQVNCYVFPKSKVIFTLSVEDCHNTLKIDVTGRGGNVQSVVLDDRGITMLEDLLRLR